MPFAPLRSDPSAEPTINGTSPFTKRDVAFLGLLAICGLVVGALGIVHYGYIGQDFILHRGLILSFPGSFSFSLGNPPALYWIGSSIRNHVSPTHYLEVIAAVFLVLNSSALWIIYRFIWISINHWQLRYAAAAFSTFIPVRVIHSIVLAADGLTLPVFALVALFVHRLFENPRRIGSWVAMSLCLSAGMLCKYTFVGLLLPAALVLAIAIWKRAMKGQRLRWGAVEILALAVPAAVFLLEMHESEKRTGVVTNQEWLAKGVPPVMRWSDMLLPKRSDLGLIRSAPEYLQDKLYGFRNYSYMGLLHVAVFADILNFFQSPPPEMSEGWSNRTQDPFVRHRTALSQALQTWSVRLCLPFSALAVAGTLFSIVLSFQSLLAGKPLFSGAAVVMTALATGFYSTVFFSLHRINDPYTAGFWLPRLVLAALLIFFILGFLLVDFICRHRERSGRAPRLFLSCFLCYTLLACLLFIGFLA